MAFTKIAAAGIGSTELVTLHSLEVLNNATVGGVLTYEDVTNVDSIGLITARNGIVVGSGVTLSKDGDGFFTGVTTATTFVGALTGNVTGNVTGNISGGTVAGSTGTFTGDVDIADKIIHTGDTNTALRFPSADTITAETGGSERLRISSNGNIGIGTAVPAHALDIQGNSGSFTKLALSNQTMNTSKYEIIFGDQGQVNHVVAANREITFATNGSSNERLRIDSDGQIGIGNIAPDTWSTGKSITIGTAQATLWGVGDQVNLSGNAYFNSGWKAAATKSGASQIQQSLGNIDFRVTGSINADAAITWTDALRITSTGLVGIGTDTPFNPLEVVGSSPDIMVYDTDAYNQNTNGGAVAFAGKDSDGNRKTFADIKGVANGANIGEFAIRTRRSGGTVTEALRIDSAGKTIIKVSDNNTSRVNATHLQIQNSDFSASACAGIMLAASNGANSEFNIVTQKHSSGTGADFHLDNGTDALMQISGDNGDIKFGVNGTMITTFTPGNGNTVTGIGMEARNGAIFLSRGDGPVIFSNRNSHGEIHRFFKDGSSVGSISTNANSLPSDKNFKKNISDLDLGLSLVNKLKPSQFNYKIDDPNTPVMYGLIAQELEESLTSEGITKNSTQLIQHRPTDNDKESDYDVDYAKLIPILINAVKELSAKVAALEG